MDNSSYSIFSGSSNVALSKEVSSFLGRNLGAVNITRFSDGEVYVRVEESVRGKDIFLIQSTSSPVNERLMELLIMVDAFKRASVSSINVIIPYFCYARQDRKVRGREPISAKLVANLIERAGVDRVIGIDFHTGQIQGFFDILVDHLTAIPVFDAYLKANLGVENLVIVSPDIGGVARARLLAERMGVPLAVVDKRRPLPNQAEAVNIIGDVVGKRCVVIDDIIDTGGTMVEAAHILKKNGVKEVLGVATHGILSGPAIERLTKSDFSHFIVTNTIYHPEDFYGPKIKVISVARLIAESIKRIALSESVSELFR